MAEYNRDFFHGLMRHYNNFFLTSNQYNFRDHLADSPSFLLETIRYDALRMIEKKMAAPFQEVNSDLLEGAKNTIANTNNIGSLIVKLEELKAGYQPRQGFFKMTRAAQKLFSDKKTSARPKQTDFQQDVSALLIKYRHLKTLSEERANERTKQEHSSEKESEKGSSPSPSRRGT